MERSEADQIIKKIERSRRISARSKELSDSGYCQRCRVNKHSDGPGATSVRCASCAEKARRYGKAYYHKKRASESPLNPRITGRPRAIPEPDDQE